MPLTQVQGGMLAGSTNTTTTIQSNGTTAITIDASQNVGIGTTNPSGFNAKTAIRNDSGNCLSLSSTGNGARVVFENIGTDAYGLGMPSGTGALAFLSSNVTERMRLTNTGQLCINNTSSPGGQPLFVKALPGVGGAGFQPQANGSGAIDWYNGTGGYVASVVVNSSNVSYNTTSDYRLKENIAPMTGALEKVQALKPVTYNWKVDGSDGQGFIAHELQEVVPDCVTGEKDAVDADGNPKYQGVDTSFLVATLTAAIQELKAELDATKAEVAALKAAP